MEETDRPVGDTLTDGDTLTEDADAATELPAVGAVPTTPDLLVPHPEAPTNGEADTVGSLIYEELMAERGMSPA